MEIVTWVLGALLVCALCALVVVCVRMPAPWRKLKKLTARLGELDAKTLRREADAIPGAAGEAARNVAEFVAASPGEAGDEGDVDAQEQVYRMRVVNGICTSLLPQPIRNNNASMVFALTGGIQEGKRRSCAFYDHFFLDGNTLCFAVGEVPGSGVAEALFSAVAQTTIRSRLRLGLSLTETMSDVNTQLYDMGGRYSLNATVCVLNIMNGRLTFVNAGGSLPILMRSEERYEWLRTPVFAPLGANESVSYRSEALRLNQGDRLFLFTSDLGEMTNRDGESFGDQGLLTALNRSRSLTHGTEEQLKFVQNEAAAFCESGDDVLSSAAITLEYKKGSRDYIFTMVPGTPEGAPDVTAFMRKTLADGGVSQKDSARQILLADELFTLCCRSCVSETDVKIECAILPEEKTLHLRMFAPMGGRDPLQAGRDSAGGTAAEYIRSHTKRAAFEAGIDRDLLEIYSDLNA